MLGPTSRVKRGILLFRRKAAGGYGGKLLLACGEGHRLSRSFLMLFHSSESLWLAIFIF